MGFMDKVKAQAEQALAMAQQGVNQGQEKLGSMQTKHSADTLLRELGAAFYAQQRTGGSGDAVQAALAAVDRHASEHGAVDTTPGPATGDSSAATPTAAPTFNPPPTFNAPPTFDPPSR